MGALWIFLGDSLAFGLFVLSASGLLLWSRLHGPRLLAVGLAPTLLFVTGFVMWKSHKKEKY